MPFKTLSASTSSGSMSVKAKAGAVALAVALAVAVALTRGPAVHAATTACGSLCSDPVNQSAGTGETLTVGFSSQSTSGCPAVTAASLQNPPTGCTPAVSLAAASSTSAGQDWVVMLEGPTSNGVAAFIADGALSNKLGIQYSTDSVVEVEATPNGVPSGQCLAYATTTSRLGIPTPGIGLAECGQVSTTVAGSVTTISSPTVWILDQANSANGFVDLVCGTSQTFALPQVLAVTGSGSNQGLALQQLSEMGGVVTQTQMWEFNYGPVTAAGIKASGMRHT